MAAWWAEVKAVAGDALRECHQRLGADSLFAALPATEVALPEELKGEVEAKRAELVERVAEVCGLVSSCCVPPFSASGPAAAVAHAIRLCANARH